MNKYRNYLNYGSMAGLAGFIAFLVYYAIGSNPYGNITWLTAWIPIVFIYLGTKRQRDTILGGAMTYGQAFVGGLIISVFWATLSGMLAYLFGTFIDASFVEMFQEEAYQGLEQSKGFMSKEMIEGDFEQIDKVSLSTMIQGDVFNKIFGGLILSLINAGVNKRKKDIFEVSEEQEA